MTGKGIAVLCVGGLAVQLFVWHLVENPPLRGPHRGEPFPALEARVLGRDTPQVLGTSGNACVFVTVMSTSCPFCSRMRHTWATEYPNWRDRTTSDLRVIWLFAEPPDRVESWTEGRTWDGVTVMTLPSGRRQRTAAWRRLGVIGTPTSYLVGRTGHVLAGIAGPRLPPSDLVTEQCG